MFKALELKLTKQSAPKDFFCALCRTPREIKLSPDLNILNYCQVFFISGVFTALTYNWIGLKGLLISIPLWAGFEFTKKTMYRRNLSCPCCGFDPTWYKRDVKMARKKVANFIAVQKEPPSITNTL